jgi:hypothetical protein
MRQRSFVENIGRNEFAQIVVQHGRVVEQRSHQNVVAGCLVRLKLIHLEQLFETAGGNIWRWHLVHEDPSWMRNLALILSKSAECHH